MSKTILFDLDHSKQRLEYYQQMKARSGAERSKILNKWIEIYTDRVQKLERQASKLGLRTQLKAGEKAASASA